MSDYSNIQSLLQRHQLNRFKSGCPTCDSKNLSACICKGGSEEVGEKSTLHALNATNTQLNQSQSTPTAVAGPSVLEAKGELVPLVIFSCQDIQLQLILKPGVRLVDIEELLEKFIKELAIESGVAQHNENLNIKELGERLGIYYTHSENEDLKLTIEDKENFTKFANQLIHQNLISASPELNKVMDSMEAKESGLSFNPSPFAMTFTPY